MKLPRIFFAVLPRLPAWLEVALVLLLLWQLAGLFWLVAGPGIGHGNLAMPVSTPPSPSYAPKGLQAWFEKAATADATATLSDLSLLAVVSGRQGVALLRWGQASSVAARVGDEFRPGSRLVEVNASGIVVEQGGVRNVVALPRAASGGASIQPVTRAIPATTPPSAAPVANVPTQSANLSRGQLSGILQRGNLAGWDKGIASYRDGGILVENAAQQSLMQALQLRNGDVMKGIAGKEIRQLSDISLIYNQISQQSSFDLSVLRDGTLQTLNYKIQP